MKTVLEPEEVLIKTSAANMMRGWEGVGGRLFLTNRRLIFESHAINFQTGTSEIPLADVAGMEKGWARFLGLPLAPTSIAVKTLKGDESRFVVFGRQAWIDAVMRAKAGEAADESRRRSS